LTGLRAHSPNSDQLGILINWFGGKAADNTTYEPNYPSWSKGPLAQIQAASALAFSRTIKKPNKTAQSCNNEAQTTDETPTCLVADDEMST